MFTGLTGSSYLTGIAYRHCLDTYILICFGTFTFRRFRILFWCVFFVLSAIDLRDFWFHGCTIPLSSSTCCQSCSGKFLISFANCSFRAVINIFTVVQFGEFDFNILTLSWFALSYKCIKNTTVNGIMSIFRVISAI